MFNQSLQAPRYRISPLPASLFPGGSWLEVKFQIASSQEVTIWWMKDGRKMMELNKCNHTKVSQTMWFPICLHYCSFFLPQPPCALFHGCCCPCCYEPWCTASLTVSFLTLLTWPKFTRSFWWTNWLHWFSKLSYKLQQQASLALCRGESGSCATTARSCPIRGV